MMTGRAGRLYHRFVKTTPKPNATKKSNGELVGPLPPGGVPPLLAGCKTPVEEDIGVGELGRFRLFKFLKTKAWTSIASASVLRGDGDVGRGSSDHSFNPY